MVTIWLTVRKTVKLKSLFDCSINQKELHWIFVVADYNSAAEWNQSNWFKPIRHICNAYYEGNKCLTLSSDGTSATVTLSSFNSSDKFQKWNAPFSIDPIPQRR